MNSITVKLLFDGNEINTGHGYEALGDQWQALLWLVNTLVDQGWKIKPGDTLITGALGKMLPGKTGKYVANFGNFGSIEFEVI